MTAAMKIKDTFSLEEKLSLFSSYHGVGNHEQQSLPRHPLRGGAGSPAQEPAQMQEVFGDCGASDQPEEL